MTHSQSTTKARGHVDYTECWDWLIIKKYDFTVWRLRTIKGLYDNQNAELSHCTLEKQNIYIWME